MSLIHPLFMLAFFYFLFIQRNLGNRILNLKEKSPEYQDREKLVETHKSYAYGLTAMCFFGLMGGVITAWKLIKDWAPFMNTYGHGFIGVLAFAFIVISLIIGSTMKSVVKPKIRERFLTFHINIIYIIFGLGILSLVSGGTVLFFSFQGN